MWVHPGVPSPFLPMFQSPTNPEPFSSQASELGQSLSENVLKPAQERVSVPPWGQSPHVPMSWDPFRAYGWFFASVLPLPLEQGLGRHLTRVHWGPGLSLWCGLGPAAGGG